jgi:TolB-like protein
MPAGPGGKDVVVELLAHDSFHGPAEAGHVHAVEFARRFDHAPPLARESRKIKRCAEACCTQEASTSRAGTFRAYADVPQILPECSTLLVVVVVWGIVMRFRIIAAAVFAFSVPAGADPFLQRPVIRIGQPVRIALPDFIAAGPSEIEIANSLSRTIASDLKQSGAFELVDQVAFPKKNVNVDVPPEFSDWRRTSTQELVTGRISRESDDRIKVEFRLWDVSSGAQLAGQQYLGSPADLSGIGHMISGDIYERVTNEKRAFE